MASESLRRLSNPPRSPKVSIQTIQEEDGPPLPSAPPASPKLAPRRASLSWQKVVKIATTSSEVPSSTRPSVSPSYGGRRASVHVDSFRRSSMDKSETHSRERRGSLFGKKFNIHEAAKMSLKRRKGDSEEENKRLKMQAKQLQASIEELQEELEEMRKSYSALQEKSSGAQSQYERTVKMLDKIRADNQGKLLELGKLRQELQTLGDRMRTLENKAMEVEKLEIASEKLKKSLETSQQDVRERERELRHVIDELGTTEKKLQKAEAATINIKEKNDDLKLQVKEELNRNTQLELRIENADALKTKITEQEKEIADAKKEAEEKALIAQHARKCLRDERDKNKELEERTSDIDKYTDEAYIVRSENQTLKRLMMAKDKMVIQKSQIISNTMNALQSLPPEEPYLSLIRILENKDTLPATFANGVNSDEEESKPIRPKTAPVSEKSRENRRASSNASRPSKPREAFTADNDNRSEYSHNATSSFFLTALDADRESSENNSNHVSFHHEHHDGINGSSKSLNSQDSKKSKKRGLNRPQMMKESFSDFRSDMGSISDISVQSFAESDVSRKKQASRTSSHFHNSSSSLGSHMEEREESPSQENTTCDHHGNDTSSISSRPNKATKSIRVGDRVIVNLAKKRDKKKNHQQGVIRYLGDFDGMYGPHKTYIGLKMDEPVGDTDGIIGNKRFFRAPPRFGKIVPLSKIMSLYDKENGIYRKVESVTSDTAAQDDRSLDGSVVSENRETALHA